jgi:CBS domain-containing protein
VNPRLRAGVAVKDIAWPLSDVTTAQPGELLNDVLRRAAGGDGRILVFDRSRLVGIVSPTDVARVLDVAVDPGARRAAA